MDPVLSFCSPPGGAQNSNLKITEKKFFRQGILKSFSSFLSFGYGFRTSGTRAKGFWGRLLGFQPGGLFFKALKNKAIEEISAVEAKGGGEGIPPLAGAKINHAREKGEEGVPPLLWGNP
jgi:hypothetical protein